MIGPGLSNLDFSVFKNNHVRKISENFNVQFRAEFFNILLELHLGAARYEWLTINFEWSYHPPAAIIAGNEDPSWRTPMVRLRGSFDAITRYLRAP